MPLTHQQQLVFDTLHYRPPSNGTCFVTNEPGLRLASSDDSFLPAVREALVEAARDRNWRKLYGLRYVMGAFLVLGTKYAPATMVPFIRILPQPFIREIVATIPTIFRKSGTSNNFSFGVAPAPELVEFVQELASTADPLMQRVAKRVLSKI
jgi:hypothetical protein